MAVIGTFTKDGKAFFGHVSTLKIDVDVRFDPIEAPEENGPHYRAFAGRAEIGAGWLKKAHETGNDYMSVRLDDPSFDAPIDAALFQQEGEKFNLVWSRPTRA